MKQNFKKGLTAFSLVAATAAVGVVGLMTAGAATKAAGFGNVWEKLSEEEKQEVVAEKEQRHEEKMAQHEEMQEALTNGDYAKWKEIIDSRPKITDYVNESNFDRFTEMHKLMQEGDFEGAKAIHDELGLPDDMGKGMGAGMGKGGKGMHKGEKGMNKGMGKGFMK